MISKTTLFILVICPCFCLLAQPDSLVRFPDPESGFSAVLQQGAYFGSSIGSIGDLNGDGIDDLGMGALYQDRIDSGFYKKRGTFWLAMLRSNGSIHQLIDLSDTLVNAGFLSLSQTGRHGYSITGIGDLNKDGTPDLAVGFPDFSPHPGLAKCGAVLILCMHPNGSIKAHQLISNLQIPELQSGDKFGHALQTIGDFDGDGIQEIAVTAPFYEVDQNHYGNIWILYLDARGNIKNHSTIPNRYISTPNRYWGWGWSIESLGDLNMDGIPDLAVGCPNGYIDPFTPGGNFNILFLDSEGGVMDFKTINKENLGNQMATSSLDPHFGESLALLYRDSSSGQIILAVGGTQDHRDSTERGLIWLLCIDTEGEVRSANMLGSSELKNLIDLEDYEFFGFRLSKLNDINQDGWKELVVSSKRPGSNGTVAVLFGDFLSKRAELKELEALAFSLFPNPSGAQIFLKASSPKAFSSTIDVFDVAGRMIKTRKLDGPLTELDVSDWKQGFYYFLIRNQEDIIQTGVFSVLSKK